MLFYDKLMEKYELVYLRKEENIEETGDETQVNESEGKEVKPVDREEVEAFALEYADTKPLGF